MLSSRRLPSKMLPCGTIFLFCLGYSTISEAQSSPSAAPPPQPKSKITAIDKSKITAMNDVPTVIHSLLAASNISAGGAAPAVVCILQDNVNVIEINGQYVEVHECEGESGDGKISPKGGGGEATDSPTPGVGTDPEDCQLFTISLQRSCSALPTAERANCQYNACVQGAKCSGQSVSQCGSKPKRTSHKDTSVCSNSYAANFNACTRKFRTIDGQNSCLYAAGQALNVCTTKSAK